MIRGHDTCRNNALLCRVHGLGSGTWSGPPLAKMHGPKAVAWTGFTRLMYRHTMQGCSWTEDQCCTAIAPGPHKSSGFPYTHRMPDEAVGTGAMCPRELRSLATMAVTALQEHVYLEKQLSLEGLGCLDSPCTCDHICFQSTPEVLLSL